MQRERETRRPRDEDEDDDVVGLNKRRRKGQSQKNPPSRIIQQAPPSPLPPTTNYEDVVVDKVVIDWREKFPRLSEVGDQGNLPLCWVFSILNTIETILEMRTGKVIQLSKQQLIDFVWTWKSRDMSRGQSVSETLDFIKKYGITTEDEYKYVGDKSKSERTIKDLKFKDLHFIKEYGKVTDTVDISRILKDGPLIIRSKFGISFRYVNDWSIFIPKEDENMYNPHGLVLVGEGKEIIDGAELYYWIVKNSWGTGWGEKGFGRIIKNNCNLKIEAWYPIL